MALKSLFPEKMISTASGDLSPDTIATKLTYFELQLHNLHWGTRSYAEHQALGGLYDSVFDLKDEIVEKIMGYNNGMRAKIGNPGQLKDYAPGVSDAVVSELISFAKQLENYGASNNMPDIENIAQSLSGTAAKTKYLLTLS
jgi:DNA-binding ferritin-like protein